MPKVRRDWRTGETSAEKNLTVNRRQRAQERKGAVRRRGERRGTTHRGDHCTASTARAESASPANATGTEAEIGIAFAEAFRMLNARISIFVNLPIAKIDRLSLQKHLHDIGAMDRPDRKTSSAA